MPSARKVAWVLLVAALAVAVLFVVYPVYVIWPFRPQRVDELALALTVKASSLVGTVVCAVVATVSAVVIWSGSRRWTSKALVLATAIATTVFAFLARVNVYELMFHRVDDVQAIGASEATLDKGEMVLAIEVDNKARAYPVRTLAYHHIANDMLGRVPVVSTY